MAIEVSVWKNFRKRKNSTKIPTEEPEILYCDWIYPVSYATPAITIDTADYWGWTYCKIEKYYYFVKDKISTQYGYWEVHLTLDVLATYRDDIFATTAFVEYYRGGSTAIPDNRLTPVSPVRGGNASIDLSGMNYAGGHQYVVQTVGSGGIGNYYVLSYGELRELGQKLYSAEPSDIFDKWTSEYYTQSPESLIISVNEYSVYVESFCAVSRETIKLGVWDSGVSAARIVGSTQKNALIAMAPPHGGYQTPDTPIDIRNYSPYTTLSLYLPFVGTVPIDPSVYFGTRAGVIINYCVSYKTGTVFYRLMSGEINLGEYTGVCAGAATLGGSSIRGGGALPSSAGVAASLLTVGSEIPILGSVVASLSDMSQYWLGTSGIATRGGGADTAEACITKGTAVLSYTTCDTTYDPGAQASTIGLPYFRSVRLGRLSGYVKCRLAYVETQDFLGLFGDFSNTSTVISGFLNGGFYVE